MAYTIGDVVTRGGTSTDVWTVTGTPPQAAEVVFSSTYFDATETGYLWFFIDGEFAGVHTFDGDVGPPAPGYSIVLGTVHSSLNGLSMTLGSGTAFNDSFPAYGWYTFNITGEVADSPTVEDIELLVRQRADMVNSEFVTSAEVQSYIEQSLYELYDLLIQKYGADYYMSSYTFTTDGVNDAFDLPTDMYKLRGVDLRTGDPSAGSSGWLSLRPHNFAERNRYVYPNTQTTFGLASNLQYHIQGDTIRFVPLPAANQPIRLWYIPRLTPVAASTPSSVTGIGDVTAKAKWEWTTSGTTEAPHRVDIFPYLVSPNTKLRIVIDGGAEVVTSGNFTVAEGTSLDLGTLTPTLTGLTIELRVISSALNTSTEYPIVGWTLDTGDWSATIDPKIQHWLEYVVVDAAIKCVVKEESDPSALMAQKVALVQRLESAAENRDAGSPATVCDSIRANGGWGWGYGGVGGPY